MYRAYLACRRTKRNKASALAFELHQEDYLVQLVAELREQRYQPSTSICFYTRKPKAREIFAAAFRDRVVHHLIYEMIAPRWERVFIDHSYACRRGKGLHAAARHLQHLLRQVSANGRRPAHFLKLDVRNFFMTMDRRVLFAILVRHCRNPEVRELLRAVVFHDPTTDYELQDRDRLQAQLPRHKSLFAAAPFCGLPIGNLTSQFFANVYLNELDQFVKHHLKCPYYVRYVDDCLLLAREPGVLRHWHAAIAAFLQQRLALTLNEGATRLGPVAGGIDFAGFLVHHGHMLVRRRVVGNFRDTLRRVQRQLVCRTPSYTAFRFEEEVLQKCLAMINSYLGHFRHAQTRRCVARLWQEFPFLRYYFRLSGHRVTRLTKPLRRATRLQPQVRWLRAHFHRYLCLIEIGRYFEAFEADARRLASLCGWHLHKNWRGFGVGCGFPRGQLRRVLVKLKEEGVPVLVVRQTGRELYATKERLPYLLLEFAPQHAPAAGGEGKEAVR